jgi:hypothetical protein
MEDQDDDMKMCDWFWKMLENIGLNGCTDETYLDDWNDRYVDQILEKIIERGYGRDGKGGLFPLKRARKDQRKVELWYQMSNYLVENYYTEDAII